MNYVVNIPISDSIPVGIFSLSAILELTNTLLYLI
jgi:hypothetical protein